jgi:anti-sigma regulatory factor (Ser/Thr protein kinase)
MKTAARGTQAAAGPPGPGSGVPLADHVRHEAVLYSAPAELAQRLLPRVGGALDTGAPVVAVLDPDHRTALRAALGTAADAVEFVDPATMHSVPAFTVAVRIARTSRRIAQAGGHALVIDQHVEGLPGCGPQHWARLDIALNVAIAGLPITVLCPYPTDAPDLLRVRATHPVLTGSGGSGPSPDYRPPRDAVIDYPPPPPPDLGPATAELWFGASELAALRRLVGDVATTAGLTDDNAADLVLAVNELTSNSIEHGPGSGMLRLWQAPGAVVAEVTDRGGGLDVPFPGLALPPPEGARGRGLWLASELCTVLEVWGDETSTVIRLHMDR